MSLHDDVTLTFFNYPILLIAVGAIVVVGLSWNAIRSRIRGKKMKKERRQFVEDHLTDMFTSDIEDCVIDGTISREEASEIYLKLKKCFPIRNLFPSVDPLKERIQKRLKSHTHAVVDLPDSVEPVKKRKHMFDKSVS
jgi:hypothetical protein